MCAAASFWLGDLSFRYAGASADAPAYHFYREDFCSNRSVMLRRLMPRVERLCSMALVAGGKDIFPLLRSYSVIAQTRAGRPVAPSMRG